MKDFDIRIRNGGDDAIAAVGEFTAHLEGEVERLRSLTRFQGGVIRSGDVACLTQSEREAVRFAATAALPETEKLGGVAGELCRTHAATLRGLLDRLG